MVTNKFKSALNHLLVVLSLLITQQWACCDQIIEVRGQYDFSSYNGVNVPRLESQFRFVVEIAGDNWRICVTNAQDRTSWQQLTYDGTNTYSLTRSNGHFVKPKSEPNFASVSPSQFYLPVVSDEVEIYFPWLTYCLSAQNVVSNKMGIVEIPLPWGQPRGRANAYGYKWLINPSEGGRFVENCEVVREASLDLDEKQELLRPTLDYPLTMQDLERQKLLLSARKRVPDGFVAASYFCTEWYRTNNISIPAVATFTRYFRGISSPLIVIKLKATEVMVRNGSKDLLNIPSEPTSVWDYRYKKANNSRIFKFAEYTLQPHEPWKAESDPLLLAEAEKYLMHGSKYDDFGLWGSMTTKIKKNLAWLLLALAQIPIMVMLWNNRQKNKNKPK